MKTSKKIPKTFFSFLIISIFIWLLITFSKEYVTVISHPVNYNNIPQNKLLQNPPLKEISFSVKASGFKLLRAKINRRKINLDASSLLKKSTSKFYILPDKQFSKIQKQLLSGVVLQNILQDTIYLNLGILGSKKVALKPNVELNFHIGYDLLENVTIQPDSIIVSGPQNQLDSLEFLPLKKLSLIDVKDNFKNDVQILKPKNDHNLKFNTAKATISGKVDKFTEGVLEIPFTIKNLPENTSLTILTENVKVSFVIALSNFAKISEQDFEIECDFETATQNNLSYLIPKLVNVPNFVKSYKIMPSKIDFLIQK